MASPEAEEWRLAAKSEYDSLMQNKTWKLVPRPQNGNVVGSRWVFTRKKDENGKVVRYKARFVAQGFFQKYGVDYTDPFSPVAQMTTIRVTLAIAADQDWVLENMDVHNRFPTTYAEMEEEIYVKQPEGFRIQGKGGAELVCNKLEKSLYGTKQAPRNWNKKLHGWLTGQQGFKQSIADPCLYVRQ
jgi:hypothetical protein